MNKDKALKQLMDWYDSGAEDRERFQTLVKLALEAPVQSAPVQSAPVQRPKKGSYEAVFGHLGMTPDELGNHMIELQEKAAQRKPLDAGEVSRMWKRHTNTDGPHHNPYDDDGLAFARAIEAAHNIKEKNT